MALNKNRLQRPLGNRRYRKMFVIAAEGKKTEPQYFALFNNSQSIIWVNCLKGNHNSSPPQILRRMKDYLKQKGLRSSDQAWLVIDKDQWTDKQIDELYEWSKTRKNYGFALSNPKFEYWLLLHYEDGNDISSSQDCNERLRRYIQNYDKTIDIRKINREQIKNAICRARRRDNPPCAKWPHNLGSTTVYKLIENILGDKP